MNFSFQELPVLSGSSKTEEFEVIEGCKSSN